MIFNYTSLALSSKRGSTLVVAILMTTILAAGVALAIKSSNTFTRVTALFQSKATVEEIAEIGLLRAKNEILRRFSRMNNPLLNNGSAPNPAVNAQYRAMMINDPSAIIAILQEYADDILDISDSCTESVTPAGSDFGTDIDDIPVCIDDDPANKYDYSVTIVNRASLQACAASGAGYLDASCPSGDPWGTKLVDHACLVAAQGTGYDITSWDNPLCYAPNSYHYGEYTGPPALGFNIVLQSTATDDKGSSATVEGDLKVFVRQQMDLALVTNSVLMDGLNFVQGGNINGQVRQMVPDNYLTNHWWNFTVGTVPTPEDFFLGRRFQYQSQPMAATIGFLDEDFHNEANFYTGLMLQQVLSNIGIDDTFEAETLATVQGNSSLTPTYVEFAGPEDLGEFEAAFGALPGFPIQIEDSGEFDKNALVSKIDEFYDTFYPGQEPTIRPNPGNGVILVNDGTSDSFDSVGTLDNATWGARQNRSVYVAGQIDGDGGAPGVGNGGPIFIDGDLVLGRAQYTGIVNYVVKGNVYILGDQTLTNYPNGWTSQQTLDNMGNVETMYDYASDCSGFTCDKLSITAAGHVIIGNPENAHVKGFMATEVSSAAVMAGINVPPLDGLRAADYSSTPAAMAPRSAQYGVDYRDQIQVGLTTASAVNQSTYWNPLFFNPSGPFSPPYVPKPVQDTVAPGLLPEGACSGYDGTTGIKHAFQWYQPTDSISDLTGWGTMRNTPEYNFGATGDRDASGRPKPTCVGGSAECTPVSYVGTNNVSLFQNAYGQDCVGGGAEAAWINPITMMMTHYASSPLAQAAGNNIANSITLGGTPATSAGIASGPIAISSTSVPTVPSPGNLFGSNQPANLVQIYDAFAWDPNNPGDTQGFRSSLSSVGLIEGSVSANGFITGWGGRGHDVASGDPNANNYPNFWSDEALAADRPDFTNSNYVDRNDINCGTVGNSTYDCDQNGITIRDGANGNIMLMTQGGLFVFSSNYMRAINPGNRMAILTRKQLIN